MTLLSSTVPGRARVFASVRTPVTSTRTSLLPKTASPRQLDAAKFVCIQSLDSSHCTAGLHIRRQRNKWASVELRNRRRTSRTNSAVMCSASRGFQEVPVLDLSLFKEGDDATRSTVIESLRRACHEVGFFYVKNHGVPLQTCDDALEVSREFFSLPTSDKMKIDYRNSPSFRGYIYMGAENTAGKTDNREQIEFGVEGPELPASLPTPAYLRLRGPNQWPEEAVCPHFRSTLTLLMDSITDMSYDLMSMLALSLQLPADYFNSTFGSEPNVQMKIARYPPVQDLDSGASSAAATMPGGPDVAEAPVSLGVGAHSDSGYLSILLQDEVGGLQAQNSEGEWIDVPPIPGTFIVNLGEMLQLATAGYYTATVHRVLNSSGGKGARLSVPYFFNPRLEAVIDRPIALPPDLPWVRAPPAQDSLTHGGRNRFHPVYGENAFKSLARSHPEVVKRYHSDLAMAGDPSAASGGAGSSSSSSRRELFLGAASAASLAWAAPSSRRAAAAWAVPPPEVGACADCVGMLEGLLNSCPPETVSCVSSQNDDEQHFVTPWVFDSARLSRRQAMDQLVEVATQADTPWAGVLIERDDEEGYLRFTFGEQASSEGQVFDAEFAFLPNDEIVDIRVSARGDAPQNGLRVTFSDGFQLNRNGSARICESLRRAVGWDEAIVITSFDPKFSVDKTLWFEAPFKALESIGNQLTGTTPRKPMLDPDIDFYKY